ncbi:MAG TPA: hypothetical protein VH137_00665 [Gemmatimonadales bacterium]|nr:hypothetical protein [Gemmatimonadales bacterium]
MREDEVADPATSPRAVLLRVFRRRLSSVLEGLAARAPREVLEAALGEPDAVSGVATLVSRLVAIGSTVAADPLLDAVARGIRAKSQLLTAAGGTWSAPQVATALSMSRQAVDKRRTRHALLAVPSGSGDYLYPRCQFTANGVIPDLDRVLGAFRVRNPWTQLSALLTPATTLRGASPLEALTNGDVEGAAAAVRSIGDTHDDGAPSV